jgi:glc operon protein GlcG
MFHRVTLSCLAAAAIISIPASTAAQPAGATYNRAFVSSEAAQTITDTCIATAREWNVSLAVAVVDPFGILIDFHSMQGASETSGTTALLKAKTAARWRRTTAEVNRMVTSGQNIAPEWIGDFPQPGAVPIIIDGVVAGAVGVGGLGPNPHNYGIPCAVAGIEAALGEGFTPDD